MWVDEARASTYIIIWKVAYGALSRANCQLHFHIWQFSLGQSSDRSHGGVCRATHTHGWMKHGRTIMKPIVSFIDLRGGPDSPFNFSVTLSRVQMETWSLFNKVHFLYPHPPNAISHYHLHWGHLGSKCDRWLMMDAIKPNMMIKPTCGVFRSNSDLFGQSDTAMNPS